MVVGTTIQIKLSQRFSRNRNDNDEGFEFSQQFALNRRDNDED